MLEQLVYELVEIFDRDSIEVSPTKITITQFEYQMHSENVQQKFQQAVALAFIYGAMVESVYAQDDSWINSAGGAHLILQLAPNQLLVLT